MGIPLSERFIARNGKLLRFIPDGYEGSVAVPDNITSVGDHAFRNSHISEVIIPSSVTSIGLGAFEECEELEWMTLPETVRYIGRDAFRKCACLREISLPGKMTRLNDCCFAQCGSLERVRLGENIIFGRNVFDRDNRIGRLDVGSISIQSSALSQESSRSIERITRAVRYGAVPDIHPALRVQLAAELFIQRRNEEAKKFLRRNTVDVFGFLSLEGRTDLMLKLAAEEDIVAPHIHELIEKAIAAEQHEVYIVLANLRHAAAPGGPPAERFSL
jgi:hypothetical protein